MLSTIIMVLIQYRSQLTLQLYEIIYLTPELYFWLCITVSPYLKKKQQSTQLKVIVYKYQSDWKNCSTKYV